VLPKLRWQATTQGRTASGNFRTRIDPTITPQPSLQASAIGVVASPDGEYHRFVLNHVVLAGVRQEELDAFLTRNKGHLLKNLVFGGQRGVRRRTFHLVHVDLGSVDTKTLEAFMEEHGTVRGEWRFSSPAALQPLFFDRVVLDRWMQAGTLTLCQYGKITTTEFFFSKGKLSS